RRRRPARSRPRRRSVSSTVSCASSLALRDTLGDASSRILSKQDAPRSTRRAKESAMRRGAILIAGTCGALLVGGAVGGVSAEGEGFVLAGVVSVEGGGGVAWLQEPTLTQDKVVTARVGERIGPYRLTKISEDQVEMEGPQGKFSVPLAGASASNAARSH